MPRFITVGYGDENGYRRTAPDVRETAHAHDATLKSGGAVIGIAGPSLQVRNPDNSGVHTLPGPYMRSDLPIAGFALIEAADLREAIEAVSKTPCAVAHGVVEIWPLQEMP